MRSAKIYPVSDRIVERRRSPRKVTAHPPYPLIKRSCHLSTDIATSATLVDNQTPTIFPIWSHRDDFQFSHVVETKKCLFRSEHNSQSSVEVHCDRSTKLTTQLIRRPL